MRSMFLKRQSKVERFIRKTPVTPWVIAAAASIPASVGLFMKGKKLPGLLVGLWTPTLLNAAIYNRVLRSA